MKKITLAVIRKYFKEQDFDCRHNMKAMKYAANNVGKLNGLDGYDIFMLVVENKPIDSAYTHSYGFHTANGRALINDFKSDYYEFISKEG